MLTNLTSPEIKNFRKLILGYYKKNGRQLPWRKTCNPYRIVVSEIMLQQTQVSRVLEKYKIFIKEFPTFRSLSQVSFKDIMRQWQGLGYNRRALYLYKLAKIVTEKYHGRLPRTQVQLEKLPGIGKATASAIRAFAFNESVVFIETNIRSVYLHYFFKDKKNISDNKILPFIEQTVEKRQPKIWYNALMDYGAYVKKIYQNPSRNSTHHSMQSRFEGSSRQLRGQIVALLSHYTSLTILQLQKKLKAENARLKVLLDALVREGLLNYTRDRYSIL